MEYFDVCHVSEITDGSMKKIRAGGRDILLARNGGQFFATDPLCPHLQADLSEGSLHGTILTCPLHNSQFDLHDGRVVRWTNLSGFVQNFDRKAHPPQPLRCYPVRVERDRVLVSAP